MTDGRDDGHGAGIERERAHPRLSWRMDATPHVGIVKYRAPLDGKADAGANQAHAALTQEGERSQHRALEGSPLKATRR